MVIMVLYDYEALQINKHELEDSCGGNCAVCIPYIDHIYQILSYCCNSANKHNMNRSSLTMSLLTSALEHGTYTAS